MADHAPAAGGSDGCVSAERLSATHHGRTRGPGRGGELLVRLVCQRNAIETSPPRWTRRTGGSKGFPKQLRLSVLGVLRGGERNPATPTQSREHRSSRDAGSDPRYPSAHG